MNASQINLPPVIRLGEEDNIVVARCPIAVGTNIGEKEIVSRSDIPLGHKIAVCSIKKRQPVIKSNTVIGYAAEDILPGEHVHVHNVCFDEVKKNYAFCEQYRLVQMVPVGLRRTFEGYVRENGRVGTRNFIAVPVVSNCAAGTARKIAAHFTPEVMRAYPYVDGVVPLITSLGCGMDGGGISMEYLRRAIAGHIRNANFYGSVVCALGCERNQIDEFFAAEQLQPGERLQKLIIQDYGSAGAVRKGIAMVTEMLIRANQCRRETVSVEHLTVALQCGGSDSFSSFSANPALGLAMDRLTAHGGTAVLSETTEIFGAEQTLTCRARTPEVAEKLLKAINWWLDYCRGYAVQINGGVTPGNNEGGLTNILEKALGSVKKGGSGPLNEVYSYAEQIKEHGLVIMDAPSYDPVSATAQFAGGCNLCVFTTGRGTCYGPQYFPTIKVASNTPLYQRMEDDMDCNAGAVIDGERTLEEMGEELFERLISVASGEKTKSEWLGMGGDEFIPWSIGITS